MTIDRYKNRHRFQVMVACLIGLVAWPPSFAQGRRRPAEPLPAVNFDNFGPGIRDQVRKAYDKARAESGNAAAVGNLAMALHTYEDFDAAVGYYQIARRLQPAEFKWTYLLGAALGSLGRHAEAIATFEEALRMKPDYVPLLLRVADSLLIERRYDESLKLYEKAVEKRPEIPQAYYGMGRIRAARKQTSAAIEDLSKACRLSPGYGSALYALALAYRDAGEAGKSAEFLTQYQRNRNVKPLLHDPVFDEVTELNAGAVEKIRRGMQLEAEGRLEESIAEHEKAVEINPRLAEARINLIQLYGRTGQPEKAAAQYRAMQEINPGNPQAHYNYGVVMLENRRLAEAAEAFGRAIGINPDFSEALLNLGVIRESEGGYDEAMALYRRAVASRPDNRRARFQLARMLIYKNKLPEAILQLEQTLKPEDGETPRYTYALGAAHARAGNLAVAIEYLRAALALADRWKQADLAGQIEKDLRILEQRR